MKSEIPSRRAADWPFAPRRFPFFYGWVIVAAGTLGVVSSVPGQTIGFSAFTDSLIDALSLNRVELATAYMFGTIGSALVLPFAGRLFDRHGARRMVVAACIGLAATLGYLSSCDLISSALTGALSSLELRGAVVEFCVLTAGFFLVRFFGQGVLTMVSRAMIGKWFHVHRGIAVGISGLLTSSTFSAAPAMLAVAVDSFGWRGAWLVLAIALSLMALVGGLLYRDNPEECGLEMDGHARSRLEPETPGAASDTNPPALIEFTAGEAATTPSFWIFNYALALPAMIGTAMTFHIFDLAGRAGVERGDIVTLFPWMAVFSIATNFAGGWLSDRVRVKYLVWTLCVAQAVASTGLIDIGGGLGRWLMIVGSGTSSGLFGLLMGVLWPRFYGRAHLGAISSLNMSVVVFASAIGPWIFARVQDAGGSYGPAAILSAGLSLVGLVAALEVENPQRAARER